MQKKGQKLVKKRPKETVSNEPRRKSGRESAGKTKGGKAVRIEPLPPSLENKDITHKRKKGSE